MISLSVKLFLQTEQTSPYNYRLHNDLHTSLPLPLLYVLLVHAKNAYVNNVLLPECIINAKKY